MNVVTIYLHPQVISKPYDSLWPKCKPNYGWESTNWIWCWSQVLQYIDSEMFLLLLFTWKKKYIRVVHKLDLLCILLKLWNGLQNDRAKWHWFLSPSFTIWFKNCSEGEDFQWIHFYFDLSTKRVGILHFYIHLLCFIHLESHELSFVCLKEGSANILDCHDHIHETPTEDGLSCFYWTTHRWIIWGRDFPCDTFICLLSWKSTPAK